jgi:predicted DNA-binding WGR domain protein
MSKRYFEFTGADSDRGTSASAKFWEIEVDGSAVIVRFGKIGATGQTTRKEFADAQAAEAEASKLIGQKVKKGYVESELG